MITLILSFLGRHQLGIDQSLHLRRTGRGPSGPAITTISGPVISPCLSLRADSSFKSLFCTSSSTQRDWRQKTTRPWRLGLGEGEPHEETIAQHKRKLLNPAQWYAEKLRSVAPSQFASRRTIPKGRSMGWLGSPLQAHRSVREARFILGSLSCSDHMVRTMRVCTMQ